MEEMIRLLLLPVLLFLIPPLSDAPSPARCIRPVLRPSQGLVKAMEDTLDLVAFTPEVAELRQYLSKVFASETGELTAQDQSMLRRTSVSGGGDITGDARDPASALGWHPAGVPSRVPKHWQSLLANGGRSGSCRGAGGSACSPGETFHLGRRGDRVSLSASARRQAAS